MRKLTLLFVLLCFSILSRAQAPQAMNYQGLARDKEGRAMMNKNMNIRISIIDGTEQGKIVYAETHDVTTNQFGLYNLHIGTGKPLEGLFEKIDWQLHNKYVKVEVLENGQYANLGTTQLLSVPYALYAETAGKSLNGVDPNEPKTARAGTQNFLSKFDATGASNAEVNSLIYDNGSRVGIGTTTPLTSGLLHLKSTIGTQPLILESPQGVHNLVQENGQNRGYFGSYIGSGGAYPSPAGTKDADFDIGTSGANPTGKLHLATQTTPRMTIDSSGQIGVNLTTPSVQFQINKNVAPIFKMTNSSTGVAATDGLDISENGLNASINNREAGILSLHTNNLERVRVDAAGNVGVGTTAPGAKLEVAGQVKITGGTPGAGKVLTSDAAGLATWQTPTGGSGAVSSVNGATGAVTNSFTLGSAGTTPAVTGSGTNAVTLNLPTASATNTGVLSAANWTTFNNKANTVGGTVNYLPKYTPNGNTLGNSQVFDNGSNVGIGTNVPSAKVEVVANEYLLGQFSNSGVGADRTALIGFKNGNTSPATWYQGVGGTGNGYGLQNGEYYLENLGKGVAMVTDTNNNFGIGTLSPNSKLQVTSVLDTAINANSASSKDSVTGSYFGVSGSPSRTQLYAITGQINGGAYGAGVRGQGFGASPIPFNNRDLGLYGSANFLTSAIGVLGNSNSGTALMGLSNNGMAAYLKSPNGMAMVADSGDVIIKTDNLGIGTSTPVNGKIDINNKEFITSINIDNDSTSANGINVVTTDGSMMNAYKNGFNEGVVVTKDNVTSITSTMYVTGNMDLGTPTMEVSANNNLTAIATSGDLEVYGETRLNGTTTINDGTQGDNKVLRSDALGNGSWTDDVSMLKGSTAMAGNIYGYAGGALPDSATGLFRMFGPQVTVTLTANQRIIVTGTMAIGKATAGSAIFDLDICYKPSAGTAVTNFSGGNYISYNALYTGADRKGFSVAGSAKPGAGTWVIRPGIRSSTVGTLNFNDYVNLVYQIVNE